MANFVGCLSTEMATRNVADLPGRPEKCTEFQVHGGEARNVIDFTERKLIKFAAKATDPQLKLTLAAMVDDYRKGHIAVAWRRGQPVYIKVTKEG
jgi:hypothetical protein